jgi:LacI family transcriptional regulator
MLRYFNFDALLKLWRSRLPPTIKDVAAEAKVSVKSVSRVLNKGPNVTPKLAARVLAAAEKLNFQPDFAARSLRSSRSYLVGLLLSKVVSPTFNAEMQIGAGATCKANGYHLIVEWLEGPNQNPAAGLVDLLDRIKLGGVIVPPPLCFSDDVLSLLESRKIPYVRILPGADPRRSSYVQIDSRQSAYDMTKHLIDLGHRAIGFLRGPLTNPISNARLEGFKDAMREARFAVNPAWIRVGSFNYDSCLPEAKRILEGRRPTAIFAANDLMALAVLSVAHERGLRVPQDISIVGCDDIPSARMSWPPLTTIRLPLANMAAQAADMLLNPTPGEGAVGRFLDFDIVVRDSSGPPRSSKQS